MDNATVTIHAEDEDTTTVVTPSADTTVVTAADARTMTGRVLPFDEPGRTSAGELIFPPGSISIPQDISRVKLLAGHSPNGTPVGVATAWHAKDDGLYMTFQLGSHAAADEALALAAEHVVDSFSIEAQGIAKQGRTVHKSLLKAVALVPFPAFGSARVSEVMAEDTEEDTTDTDTDTTEDAEDGDPDDTTDTTDTDTTEDAEDGDPDTTEEDTDMPTTPTKRPAAVPAGLGTTPTNEAHATLADVLDFIRAARDGEPTEAHAALTDITRSGMVDAIAPAWLGEVWNGVTYTRRIIPELSAKNLTSMKMTGYKWTTKPGVDKYTGDKAEIPSKPAAVEPVDISAQRWAGGNDLDRAFWDFNETEILASYWAAMAESYAMETDHDAAAWLNTNATVITEAAPDFIRGIARAGLAVLNATDSPATFAFVNPLDMESVLDFAELDAPKYIDMVAVANPAKWIPTTEVTRGTAIVGTKSAVDFYELAGSPLRVEAEHLAHGGRDAALFGYTAIHLAKPGGVQKVTVGTPAGA